MREPRFSLSRILRHAAAAGLIATALPTSTSAQSTDAVVRYGTNVAVSIPDASSRVSSIIVDGVGSPILNVRVLVHITHPSVSDLDISLTGPDGTRVDLSSDNGGTGANYGSACAPDSSLTTFDDGAATAIQDGTTPFVGSFRPEQPLAAFDGKVGAGAANGVWLLQVGDDTAGNIGTLQCWWLLITASITAPTSLDDTYTARLDTPLIVPAPGVLANDDTNDGGAMTAAVVGHPSHGTLTFSSDGGFTYIPESGYLGPDVFSYRATNSIGPGNLARVDLTVTTPPPTAVDDGYVTPFQRQLSVPVPGVLANDVNPNPTSSMSAGLVAGTTHGTLVLSDDGSFTYAPVPGYAGPDSFTYRAVGVGGPSNTATVWLAVSPPTNAQPPTALYAYSVAGNLVTLRWTPPALGPAPTQYVLEGGVLPGQVLASFPTGTDGPAFTFVAPTGSFHVRMHSLVGADKSDPSNEILLHVNVPVLPSAPVDLLGVVDGSTLHLAWRNTYDGGPPARMVLSVGGAFTGDFLLGPDNTFAYAPVPPGVYTLRVSASNAAGLSASSAPVTLRFPGPCTGAPLPPSGFLAYRVGRTIFVIWDPAESGPAPTGYLLSVGGGFTGVLPTAGRALSGTVAPGRYDLSVVATNPCGVSAFTPVQTVVVP